MFQGAFSARFGTPGALRSRDPSDRVIGRLAGLTFSVTERPKLKPHQVVIRPFNHYKLLIMSSVPSTMALALGGAIGVKLVHKLAMNSICCGGLNP